MKNEDLKKALLEEIENCENNDLLLEALLVLLGPSPSSRTYIEAKEAEANYETQHTSIVPQAHWDLLKEQSEKLANGEISATPWEEFEVALRKKYDL
ncbi:hypothetical protein [Aequorivita echinoideorum]|uniref:Addiction module component n=1 Tax=Aequorivita echinoideorum TaxID=1549647 RepID=A0ABS5S232_9FLAO|nr:hypothetical protein [Aequorivita echinoideorum]MBT0607265.1 hypothetical protein [Aequorivita echinoideorum]